MSNLVVISIRMLTDLWMHFYRSKWPEMSCLWSWDWYVVTVTLTFWTLNTSIYSFHHWVPVNICAKFEQEFEESDTQLYRYSHYPECVGLCLVNASVTAMHAGQVVNEKQVAPGTSFSAIVLKEASSLFFLYDHCIKNPCVLTALTGFGTIFRPSCDHTEHRFIFELNVNHVAWDRSCGDTATSLFYSHEKPFGLTRHTCHKSTWGSTCFVLPQHSGHPRLWLDRCLRWPEWRPFCFQTRRSPRWSKAVARRLFTAKSIRLHKNTRVVFNDSSWKAGKASLPGSRCPGHQSYLLPEENTGEWKMIIMTILNLFFFREMRSTTQLKRPKLHKNQHLVTNAGFVGSLCFVLFIGNIICTYPGSKLNL